MKKILLITFIIILNTNTVHAVTLLDAIKQTFKNDDLNISIKATTTDNLGFIGKQKGVAAITTCLLINND